MKPIRLSRRTVLRGAGIALAMPTLDAMLTDGGLLVGTAGAQPRKLPPRLVIFFIPNGVPASPESTFTDVKMPLWTPATTGRDFVVNQAMLPLTPFRDDINVLTNLDLMVTGGGGHERGTAGFATAMSNGGNGGGAQGPSLEQVAAKYLGDTTRLRSLVVSDNTIPSGGYSIPLSFISYAGPGQPIPPIRTTRPLFDALFKDSLVGTGSGPSDLVLRRRSVMDFVSGDLTRLNRVLGSSDRQRLDAHLAGVRELERQLALTSSGAPASTSSALACAAPAAPTIDGKAYSDASERLLLDMMAMALKCDITRYASFMVAFGGASGGPAPGEHALCHAHAVNQILPITQYQVGLFAHLLDRLRDDTAREADGTVLDNSLLYMGAEMSDGGQHSNSNVPVVLAGKAGGAVKTGRHIVYPPKTNISKMMLAMLKLGGVPVDEFAGNREALDGLTTG